MQFVEVIALLHRDDLPGERIARASRRSSVETEPPAKAEGWRRVVKGRPNYSQGNRAIRDPRGVTSKLTVRRMGRRFVGDKYGSRIRCPVKMPDSEGRRLKRH